jgi:hypothetical protein
LVGSIVEQSDGEQLPSSQYSQALAFALVQSASTAPHPQSQASSRSSNHSGSQTHSAGALSPQRLLSVGLMSSQP